MAAEVTDVLPYTLGAKIGAGSYGVVYCGKLKDDQSSASARSQGLPEVAAVKRIAMATLGASVAQDNLVREIQLLQTLNHPHIVKLYDHFVTYSLSTQHGKAKQQQQQEQQDQECRQYQKLHVDLVFELCTGGSLASELRRRPGRCLSEKTARYYLRQLASAMSYMHELGIMHLDIKPANLLLCSRGPGRPELLKVADFGFALQFTTPQMLLRHDSSSNVTGIDGRGLCQKDGKRKEGGRIVAAEEEEEETAAILAADAAAAAAIVRGSPLYMAPEILQPGRAYDARADLWSCGAVLYEALYGRPPFASATEDQLVSRMLSGPAVVPLPPRKPALSTHGSDLLSRLLVRDPEGRLSFQAFLDHEFVDLAHCPSAESLDCAARLVGDAVALEEQGELRGALQAYREADAHFTAAVDWEVDKFRAQRLQARAAEYAGRAVEIEKRLDARSFDAMVSARSNWLKGNTPPENATTATAAASAASAAVSRYMALCVEADAILQRAEDRDLQHRFTDALTAYGQGINLLSELRNQHGAEITPDQKLRLTRAMARCLDRAEHVKMHLVPLQRRNLGKCGEHDTASTGWDACVLS